MLNAVGIDVSKGKSTIAVLRPAGEIVRKPFDVSDTVKKGIIRKENKFLWRRKGVQGNFRERF